MVSTVQERLLDRTRLDLGDLPQPFDYQFVGDGIRDHFYVEHRPFDEASTVLMQDGFPVNPDNVGAALDGLTGMVVFAEPPEPGTIWEVQGTKWRYFSDEDLQTFIDTSVAQHSHNRSDSSGGAYNTGDIPPVEEYPIALYATIQALWALATDAAFDIDILAPDGVNIPRSERYRQLMDIIAARQRQYDDLAAALNIGVARLEVVTARRIAKSTNRLVPVTVPQEYDDHSRVKRILFPPMLQGTEAVKTPGISNHDWDIVSGDPIGATFDFPFSLVGCIVENAIRRAPTGGDFGVSVIGPPVGQFTQTVIDANAGKIRLSLTGKQTRTLPYNCYWELQVTMPGETESNTKLRGMVRTTNNEIVRGSSGSLPIPTPPASTKYGENNYGMGLYGGAPAPEMNTYGEDDFGEGTYGA